MSFEINDIIEDRSDMDELLVYLSTIFLIVFGIILISFCLKLALWIYIGSFYPDHVRGRQSRIPSWSRSDPPNSNIYTITDAHMRNAPAYNNDIILIESARDESRPVPASVVKDDSNLPTYDEVIAAGIPIEPANADNTMPPAPPYSAIDPHKARVDVPRP